MATKTKTAGPKKMTKKAAKKFKPCWPAFSEPARSLLLRWSMMAGPIMTSAMPTAINGVTVSSSRTTAMRTEYGMDMDWTGPLRLEPMALTAR